ncbi:MAG TPA: cytochrome b/b6, partial [Sphingomicrobium sp.]
MSFSWAKAYEPKHPLMKWLDERLPLPRLVYGAVGGGYPVPRNLNYWWNFGFSAGIFLTIQIITGIVLAMHYAGTADGAFHSVNGLIMRDVNAGWLLRYAHMNGASFFFIVVYIHIFRGLYYGSYKAPRELVWMLGLVIYLLMMATAFMGYVLPWGQMSYWGAQVITGFFSAFPVVGEPIRIWLLGGYAPDQAALSRFFSLHYLLPFVIAAVVILHIWALHIPGSGNPTGVDVKDERDTIPFHPFYTAKDGWFVGALLLAYAILTFFAPNYLGHADNYIPANPLATPAEIVPEWYFWPFYAILRSFTFDFMLPAKLWGVLAMFASILLLFFLPWLDRSPVRSGSYRPVFQRFFWLLVIDVIALGWAGGGAPTPLRNAIGQISAAY